ncbi:MAG: aminopeptidase [Candidatus Marinimicrobia bacterium]|nr:aminopeptidase [Candidatus Neomarinimicrobiota bacterium]
MFSWAEDIFPFNRSITGPGVRKTLKYIKKILPKMNIHSIPSGEKVFDWSIPDEWFVKEAYIENENGEKVVDYLNNNLHLVGYSIPVNKIINLDELKSKLYTLPEQPDSIPYITSYYKKDWGFCISHNQYKLLKSQKYKVVIDSTHKSGFLNYGELIIPGKSTSEVFLSTYICHPSMGNNETSGPVVATALAKWLSSKNNLNYTYRIIFIPETIGSIAYISKNIDDLKKLVIAGFNITCVGDNRCYSYLPSRNGNSLSDKVAKHVLKFIDADYKSYSWLDRGSDERQYCAPGVDLPIATIMRSKYGEYPEYHTSEDNLNFISPKGLLGGFNALKKSIQLIENNTMPKIQTICEPQLGKRGLYPTISTKQSNQKVRVMMNMLSYCDGENSLLDIANIIGVPMWEIIPIADILYKEKIIINEKK